MKALFELEWYGEAAERHFRKIRPLVNELPWGTIDKSRHAPEVLEQARIVWSSIALSEYHAAGSFADVLGAAIAACAPLDIIGMAGDFVADELMHTELASRVAMELGGGAPVEVDFDKMGMAPSEPNLDAFARANDLVIRASCVTETISGAIAVETRTIVEQPLIRAVVEQIARDEARHMRFGWLYMDWAVLDMHDDERARLGRVAVQELTKLAPSWQRPPGSTTHGRDFGWLEGDAFRARMRMTILDDIVAPLEKLGIPIDHEAVRHAL
jgi:hypothetical protein